MGRLCEMEMFVRIVEAGSFSAAARDLNMGQPAVSKTIAGLEDRLGVRLLVRSTRRLSPTISRDGLIERGARTIERMRMELVDLGGGSYRVRCQAYIVSGAGDSFLEEEHRLTNLRSGPYHSLLSQMANQLK